jgi:hypothetical protein
LREEGVEAVAAAEFAQRAHEGQLFGRLEVEQRIVQVEEE